MSPRTSRWAAHVGTEVEIAEWAANCSSARHIEEKVNETFEEQERQGMMLRTSREAKEVYRDRLRIASGMPISLAQGEHVSLRHSFQKAFGRMEDEGFPASGVIEHRLQEVEQGNPTAEPRRCFFRRGFARRGEPRLGRGRHLQDAPLDAEGPFAERFRGAASSVSLAWAHLHHREVAEPRTARGLRRRLRRVGSSTWTTSWASASGD